MMAGQTYFIVHKLIFSFKATSILPLLIFGCYERIVIGTVTLSPMAVAPVCHVGDPLQLMCNASVEFIRWNILQDNEQGILEQVANVQINSRDVNVQMSERELDSATFTFMRTSTQLVSPLVSTLSIDLVSIGLNGTVVRCSDVADPMKSASTTIYISAANSTVTLYRYTPSVRIISEEFDIDNVTVTVEWTQQVQAGDLISYNVSVIPPVPISYNGNTSLILVLEYNSEYDLSVEANIQCESNATASITLNYVACEHPLLNMSLEASLNVVDYKEPAINGTMVSFNCSQPGAVLIGPSTATCMEDGQWIPNPNQLERNCKVSCSTLETNENVIFSTYNSTLEGSTISFRCMDEQMGTDIFTSKCFRNASWVPDPISQCAIDGERGRSHESQTVTITGSLFGVLTAIILILLAVTGTVIFVKKGSLWRPQRRNMACNFELHKKHKHTVHEQQNEDVKDSIVYAVLGQFSSNRSQKLKTHKLDEDQVEYAKINYNIAVPQNPMPVSLAEKPTKSDEDMSLNLDSLLIQLKDKVTETWHQFGEALGVEKEILDRCLNYSPEQSIVEMLDHWLRSCDIEERNWRDVAKALRQIKHHQLAEEIGTIDTTEPDDVPGNVLQHALSESDPAIDESPPSKDTGNLEDFQYGDIIRFNLPT